MEISSKWAQDGSGTFNICYNLVGGIPTPLKNMSSSVGMIVPNHQPDYIYIFYNDVLRVFFLLGFPAV